MLFRGFGASTGEGSGGEALGGQSGGEHVVGSAGAHAGSPSTQAMNWALTTSYDSILKDPDFGETAASTSVMAGKLKKIAANAASEGMEYLSTKNKKAVVVADLTPRLFAIDDGGAGARLVLRAVKDKRGARKRSEMEIFTISKPSHVQLGEQLRYLRTYADLRADRVTEINVQISDILSFFGASGHLNASGRKHTLTLLSVAITLTVQTEMLIKHLCRTPRPIEASPEVFPIIQTPDHSSFPSGHATESFVVASLLHRLMTGRGPAEGVARFAVPFTIAHRIAVNRTIAGVHYPADSAAGAILGCTIAEALAALALGSKLSDPTLLVSGFSIEKEPDSPGPHAFMPDSDFTLDWLEAKLRASSTGVAIKKAASPWADLWALAQEEW